MTLEFLSRILRIECLDNNSEGGDDHGDKRMLWSIGQSENNAE